jgi:hypothetical protein
MPAFELINVQVALGGDIRSIVDRSYPENAVTWPEYEIIAHIHGAGSMRAAANSGETVSRTQAEERERLIGLYGAEAMGHVYGGTAAALPTKAAEEIPKAEKKKAKPKAEAEPEPAPDEADMFEPDAEPDEDEEEKGKKKPKVKDLPK